VLVGLAVNDQWHQDERKQVTVRVRLHRGDARAVGAPVAVMGDRNPLRRWLEQEHGAVFEPMTTRGPFDRTPARTKQASPASGPWQHVITVRTNVRRDRGTRLANDLSDTLDWAIKQWTPSEIVVLPLTWRDPAAVAMNTLMALWLLAYYSELITRAPWADRQYILPSLDTTDGTDRYMAALRNSATAFYDWLARIWERDVIPLLGQEHVLDRQKVIFAWAADS
jgi:hypothetical protein